MKKVCIICGVEKDLREYGFKSRKKNGPKYLDSRCKLCKYAQKRKYEKENKELISAQRKFHRERKKTPEDIARIQKINDYKKWKDENPEEYKKLKREKAREKAKEYKKKLKEENPELYEEKRKKNYERLKELNPLSGIWSGMKKRCYGKDKCYNLYGGKGIKICQEWLDDWKKFQEFALNNGWQKGYGIHRIDSNGDYEPGNVVFLSKGAHSQFHADVWRGKEADINDYI